MTRTALVRLLGVFVLALTPLAGCQTNAATGRSQFLGMSREQEIALGAEAAPQFTTEYGGAVPDAQIRSYLTGIGNELAATTEADNPALPWEFTMLDSDVVNAFALPGGKVFMSRGLVERMENEAQLAAVVGHEIGHVTARHTSERIGRSQAFQIGAAIAVVAAGESESDWVRYGVPGLVVGGQLVMLQYDRNQELEADALGVRYMVNKGYDPRGALGVQEILLAERGAGGGALDALTSTHPHPEDRIAQIERMLRGDYAYTQNNPDYRLGTQRFQQNFLSRVSALPPAKHSPPIRAEFALADPASWCAHCATR